MLSDEAKAVAQMFAERRRQNGIRLKRITLTADEQYVELFHAIYEAWVAEWGKEGALDYLLSAMCEATVKLQEWKDAKRRSGKGPARLPGPANDSANGRDGEAVREGLDVQETGVGG
jgi:hypothetical protein